MHTCFSSSILNYRIQCVVYKLLNYHFFAHIFFTLCPFVARHKLKHGSCRCPCAITRCVFLALDCFSYRCCGRRGVSICSVFRLTVYRSDDTHPPQLPWLSFRTIPYLIDKVFLGTWAPRRWYVLQVMHVVFRSFNAKHFIAFQFYVFYCSRFSRRATDYVQIRLCVFVRSICIGIYFFSSSTLRWIGIGFGADCGSNVLLIRESLKARINRI